MGLGSCTDTRLTHDYGRIETVYSFNLTTADAGALTFTRVIPLQDFPSWVNAFSFSSSLLTSNSSSGISACIVTTPPRPACELCDCDPVARVVDCSNGLLTRIPRAIPPNTTQLLLANNNIADIDPLSVDHLLDLEVLDFSRNLLTEDPFPSISHMLKLKELLLSQNRISGLPHFNASVYSGLTRLSLVDNFITQIRASAFASSSLESMSLSDNRITTIANLGFDQQPKIAFLDFTKNRISTIGGLAFAGSSNLLVLQLSENYITSIHDDAFQTLRKLTSLDVSRQLSSGVIPPGRQLRALPALLAVRWNGEACPAGFGLGFTDPDTELYLCLPCPDGSFLEAGIKQSLVQCAPCSPGMTDEDRDGATPCSPCGAGIFVGTGNAGPCDEHLCPPGTFDHDNIAHPINSPFPFS